MTAIISGDHEYAIYTNDKGDFKYILTEHENELSPARRKVCSNNFEELKAAFPEYVWREPNEDDEANPEVLLIGE